MRLHMFDSRRLILILFAGSCFLSLLHAEPDTGRARIALFQPAAQKEDSALAALLCTVADSVELSLDLLQRYEVRRLPPADPAKDLNRVRTYCQENRIDQAILGSGSARKGGGYAFRLVVYDRKTDRISTDRQGASSSALDTFDVTDALVASLLDGLSGEHLLFGSLSVESDPAGAIVSVNGKEVGQAPLSLRGLPVGTVQLAARMDGREQAKAAVTIVDGETTSASLTLPRSMGSLVIGMPKDAVARVRSTEIGQKELTGPGTAELPTGEYDVEATCPGLPPVAARLMVNRGASTSWLPWPKGYLDVQAVPAGATVMVDGVERGVSPLVVEVEPETQHRVELQKNKYTAYRADVTAAVGDKTSLTPALVPLPGSIRVVTSIAGANISLDYGLSAGKTPYLFENVQSGQHLVRIFDVRVGNRMYTVGDNVQVEVSPGETTLVSKTFVEGKGHLTIEDAPAGSIITIDGKSVDSEKALTTGLDVPAGWMDVVVQGPDSQEWTNETAFVGTERDTPLSISDMALVLPHRTIKIDGKFEDWNGIMPAFSSGTRSPESKNLAIDKVYLAVDEKNLYMRFDIEDATPSSFFHPNNFDTAHRSIYGLFLSNGVDTVYCELQFNPSPGVSRWGINVGRLGGQGERIPGTYGEFAMKGSSAEASFPLEPIKKLLGSLGATGVCRVHAHTENQDSQWRYISGAGDFTEDKKFSF